MKIKIICKKVVLNIFNAILNSTLNGPFRRFYGGGPPPRGQNSPVSFLSLEARSCHPTGKSYPRYSWRATYQEPMILSLALVVLVRSSLAWDSSVSNELIELLQAPLTQQFESLEHMRSHVGSYTERLFDESSEKFSKQHSFILRVKETFDFTPLSTVINQQRFEVMGRRHYRVAMTPSMMQRFVQEHPEGILSVVPVLAAMKIERSVYEIPSKCKPHESASIIVETTAIPQSDFEAFLTWLDGMSVEESLPFEYDRSAMRPDMQRLVGFSTSCNKVLTLAQLLAENSEVGWIEVAKQMKHTNFWARGE